MVKIVIASVFLTMLLAGSFAAPERTIPVFMWSDYAEFADNQGEIVENVDVSTVTGIAKSLFKHTQSPYLSETGSKPDVIAVFGFEELKTEELVDFASQYGDNAEEDNYFFETMQGILEKEPQHSLVFPYVRSFSLTTFVTQMRSFARRNLFEVNLRADGKDRILKMINYGHLAQEGQTEILYIGLGSMEKMLQGSAVDQKGFFELVDMIKGKFEHPVFMLTGSTYIKGALGKTERHSNLNQMSRRLDENDPVNSDEDYDTSALNGTTVTGLIVFIFFLFVVGTISVMLLNTQTPINYTKIPLLKGKESQETQ